MGEFLLKYADAQGGVHERVETADSEQDLRRRYGEDGFLVYSIKPRRKFGGIEIGGGGKRLNLEQFLIFNQQFVTLIRAGLPILQALDLLRVNIKNRRLASSISQVHELVESGVPLSDAFASQGGFPPIYVTSLMAGERSGSLPEVIERYVKYQKVALSVRKKVVVSLIYPTLLITLVFALILFLVTYVVPEFSALYDSMDATLPTMTLWLVAFSLTLSENLALISVVTAGLIALFIWQARSDRARDAFDRVKIRIPLFGPIWVKYQVSQVCRLMSTLLAGGIPLVQTLETAGESLGSRMIRDAMSYARGKVQEGRPLSKSLAETGVVPDLAVEMIHVGESTGALPEMLNSVAEFFDEDVETMMTAALSLIEPVIMLVLGAFVAFVLISLYLPIFSLAEQI